MFGITSDFECLIKKQKLTERKKSESQLLPQKSITLLSSVVRKKHEYLANLFVFMCLGL